MTIIQAAAIIVGVLMYALSGKVEIKEIGRIMFWTGLLSFLLTGFANASHVPWTH